MATPVDGIPNALTAPSVTDRKNGIRMRTTSMWKKGPIALPDGSEGFGEVWRKVLREEVEMLQPRKEIVGPPATVAIGRGLTIPLAEFTFARVDEFVSMPCNATPEEVESTRLDLRREIEAHVEAERVRIKGTLKEKVACVKAGLLKQADFDPETWSAVETQLKA